MSVTFRRTCGALCVTAVLLPAARAAADELPRYRLKVGQELTYRQSSESKFVNDGKPEPYGSETEWHVWVLRQNADGSWRLLFRQSHSSWSGADKKVRPGYASLGYCDLFPDGRNVVPAPAGVGPDNGMDLDPASLFPRLPDDGADAAKGWEGWHEFDEARTRYARGEKASRPGSAWAFTGVRETPLDKVYLRSSQATYTYNPGRGLVVKSAGTTSRGGVGVNTATTGLELREVKQGGASAATQLAAEAERYFAAAKIYDDQTDRAENAADAGDICV
jgi:hypothetical protein